MNLDDQIIDTVIARHEAISCLVRDCFFTTLKSGRFIAMTLDVIDWQFANARFQ